VAKKDDKLDKYSTSKLETENMGQTIEDMMLMARNIRRSHEKRWYDNNFFDDGYHFRFLSRSTGRIVDLSKRTAIYTPLRVIPKASRQIRGVANLLVQSDLTPVVYPEKVEQANYEMPQEYEMARQTAKDVAKKIGHWLQEEWKNQNMTSKKAQMGILTAKHGVSYLQVWPDAVAEAIKTQVYDAFDIYLIGSYTDIYDCPFIIKAVPKLISEIKANENFDEDQLRKISPDNRHASSEIKEAYMASRFGKEGKTDAAATLILKEAYIKEYLNSNNMPRIRKQKDGDRILQNKEEGDPIVRQIFVAGNVWLRDVYTDLPDYPFVDLRFEPGPIYQVPLIERFKSTNKSLDSVISRLERYTHTMTTGTWMKRRGEPFKISNIAGGQIIEYDATPPVQGQMVSLPAHVFNFITLLNQFMEEQGVTTTAMGKIPKGVKAHAAIESLKQTEYANLVIATQQLKQCVKTISEKMLDIADNYFMKPQTIMILEKGEPTYFDIIGNRGYEARKELDIGMGEAIPIKKEYKVDIETEAGLGYTMEGKRASMLSLGEYMMNLAQIGYIPPEAVKVVVERLLETYQFGATAEFMEAMEKAGEQMGFQEQQIQQIKVALAEVFADIAKGGGIPSRRADREQAVEESKVGAAEAIRDISKKGGG